MKHIKTYEIFGFFKKKKKENIDIDTLKDLLDSELSDINFRGVNIGEHYTIEKEYYSIDIDGRPKMRGNIWFGEHITYAMKPPGNIDAFIDRGIDNVLTRINSGRYGNGFSIDVLKTFDDAHGDYKTLDTRESVFLLNKVFNHISKERLKEYGIGCCRIECDSTFRILFYPL